MAEATFTPQPIGDRASHAAAAVMEARSEPRVAVNLPARLWSRDFDGSLSGQARDLSVGGVCVATDSVFAFKSVRRVALALPGGVLELPAEGRWQGEGGDRTLLTGVAFAKPSPEAVGRLWEVVHASGRELGLFLYGHAALGSLSPDDAMSLAQVSRFRLVEAGRPVYRQDGCRPGDDSVFVVHRGEIRLCHRFGPAREVTLDRLGVGGVLGGLPLVAETPNLETALADRETTLLEITSQAFSYLRVAHPLLAQRLSQAVARIHTSRLRKLVELASRTP